jgi:hypothetical protein
VLATAELGHWLAWSREPLPVRRPHRACITGISGRPHEPAKGGNRMARYMVEQTFPDGVNVPVNGEGEKVLGRAGQDRLASAL